MLGIDTNIVVRLLTLDPPEQARRARDLIARHEVFVSVTVILETAWVLRECYELAAEDIARALDRFCALAQVTIGEAQAVRRALRWMEAGLDFADALHLAQDGSCEAFATFDKKLAKRARGVDSLEVRLA